MYRTSNQIRIASAALAMVCGLGFVATAGGALRDERAPSSAGLRLVKLEAVVVTPHQSRIAAACEQSPKAAL